VQFDEESAWTWELGVRRTFVERRAAVSAALFLVDWEDMQLSQFDPVIGGYVDNVGEAESRGLELEGQAEIVESLTGFASLGWMSSEIDEFVDSFGNDTSGNELPQAPETTWSLGLEYGGELALLTEGRWFVRGEYNDVGEFFYDAGNLEGDDYALVNFRAGVTAGPIGLSVWVRNAFDEEYVPVAFQPSPADPTTFVGESGAPRVIGLTLSAHL
jgi:iron complex outermembrane receptor protein